MLSPSAIQRAIDLVGMAMPMLPLSCGETGGGGRRAARARPSMAALSAARRGWPRPRARGAQARVVVRGLLSGCMIDVSWRSWMGACGTSPGPVPVALPGAHHGYRQFLAKLLRPTDRPTRSPAVRQAGSPGPTGALGPGLAGPARVDLEFLGRAHGGIVGGQEQHHAGDVMRLQPIGQALVAPDLL